MTAAHQIDHAHVLVELRGLDLDSPSGRPLIRGLAATIAAGERVALLGRNGVGKSSLLALIAGQGRPAAGQLDTRGSLRFVAQQPSVAEGLARAAGLVERGEADPRFAAAIDTVRVEAGLAPLAELAARPALSRGELRKLLLLAAFADEPDLLILDEPSADLDAQGLDWLACELEHWPHALLVASHSRRVLRSFGDFFVLAESGCRYLPGSFDAVEAVLEREALTAERKYVEGLAKLDRDERAHRQICQRRARKKNLGRVRELRRATPRSRLNGKRSYAQESQARVAKIRADRLARSRGWTSALRRALRIELPLDGLVAKLAPDTGEALIVGRGLACARGGTPLFEGVELELGRERVAITGPNGAGKTSLVEILVGQLEPSAGEVVRAGAGIGVIAQGGANWVASQSLIEALLDRGEAAQGEALARAAALVVGHRFPLALASRPLAELSPGERVRAALICLVHRRPAVELLVLDEPSVSLDFVGAKALTAALRAWPGGLLVASHDVEFLAGVGFDRRIALG